MAVEAWLERRLGHPDIVLAPPEVASWIARAGGRMYIGYPGLTLAYDSKVTEVRAFYGDAGTPGERERWLDEREIRYVVVTPGMRGVFRPVAVLQLRFETDGYAVFEVDRAGRRA
jgi:hypothetical protein